MKQNDTGLIGDISGALRLLTRLPMPASDRISGPRAAWAWPIAGAVIGGLAALLGLIALPLGAGVAAALVLGAQAMMTGAMHEDGLADTADGLWGGWEPARRLEIMKDSHIGTYGVMALLVVGLVRWSAIAALLTGGMWWGLIAVAMLSRAPMAVLMAVMPNARGKGLAQSVGQVPKAAACMAVLIGLAATAGLGWVGLWVVVAVAAVVVALALVAWAKIGGQTGDILGASQQLAEATGLAILAACL
ncbi:adenosylcobinamide-GDP ribazoletransferase [Pseudorhodobacter sp. W20_MBD10_FR17]|uniref:adenosylcobinamide-GDP ribazoletransferase n=1 Tax=Pseudorhodobacter sp. W20_MBD10_FR17 TaxID=3240266 RepID=UPI003F9619D4